MSATGPAPATGDAPPPPPRIPDYDLVRRIGWGGFGEVWLARDLRGVFVAVKVLPRGTLTDVEVEGLTAVGRRVESHPHLIEIKHIGRTDAHLYVVMELADDASRVQTFDPQDYTPRTLVEELRRRAVLPVDEALNIVLDLLSAVAHLHARDLLHRDIKPPNIVFVGGAVKLVDMSLATRLGTTIQPGGTLPWCPAGGVTDTSGDLYSVGCVLYWLVTGLSPERRPELPDWKPGDARLSELIRVMPAIDRACHADAAKRYASAHAFAADVRALRSHSPDAGTAAVQVPARRRSEWLAPAAAALVLLLGAVVVWMWSRGGTPATASALGHGLVIEAKKSEAEQSYFIVEPSALPLRAGNIVRLRATLDGPCFPVVALVADGKAQIAYPPADRLNEQKPLAELSLPAGENQWWPLTPPDGTTVFVVLSGERPVRDAAELESLKAELVGLGSYPVLPPDVLVRVSDEGVRVISRDGPQARGVADVTQTVRSPGSALERLPGAFAGRFRLAGALAVPQHSN